MYRRRMRDWRLLVIGLSGLATISCGGNGGGGGPVVGITPACVDFYMVLHGVLDGQPLDAQIQHSGSLFQQVQQPYTFDVDYSGGGQDGHMHLEWTTRFPIDGPAVPITGTIVMPAGVPHDGETLCAGSGAIRQVDTSGGGGTMTEFRFSLEMLSTGFNCAASSIAGLINGCING